MEELLVAGVLTYGVRGAVAFLALMPGHMLDHVGRDDLLERRGLRGITLGAARLIGCLRALSSR